MGLGGCTNINITNHGHEAAKNNTLLFENTDIISETRLFKTYTPIV